MKRTLSLILALAFLLITVVGYFSFLWGAKSGSTVTANLLSNFPNQISSSPMLPSVIFPEEIQPSGLQSPPPNCGPWCECAAFNNDLNKALSDVNNKYIKELSALFKEAHDVAQRAVRDAEDSNVRPFWMIPLATQRNVLFGIYGSAFSKYLNEKGLPIADKYRQDVEGLLEMTKKLVGSVCYPNSYSANTIANTPESSFRLVTKRGVYDLKISAFSTAFIFASSASKSGSITGNLDIGVIPSQGVGYIWSSRYPLPSVVSPNKPGTMYPLGR